MVSVPARRLAVAYATERGLSQRRACTLIGVGRSALRYRSRKAEKDAPVVRRMAELSARYPRYGYRRIRIFLDSSYERGSRLSLVVRRAVAGSTPAAAEARCRWPAAAAGADRAQPGVGL